MYAGATERIDAQLDPRTSYQVKVNDIFQIVHVGIQEIVTVGRRRLERFFIRNTMNASQSIIQIFVGALLNHAYYVGFRGATVGRIVFVSAIRRRIMRRSDDDAIGQPARATAIISKDR